MVVIKKKDMTDIEVAMADLYKIGQKITSHPDKEIFNEAFYQIRYVLKGKR